MKKYLLICMFFFGSLSNSAAQEDFPDSARYSADWVERFNYFPGYRKEICELLNLPPIAKGIDSFSFRLWSSSMTGAKLRVFRKENGQWKGRYYRYISPIHIDSVSFKPMLKADRLIDSLRKIDFYTLIPQLALPGFQNKVDDGVLYFLEVMTMDRTKVLTYANPADYTDPSNKMFAQVINLIEEYFSENFTKKSRRSR